MASKPSGKKRANDERPASAKSRGKSSAAKADALLRPTAAEGGFGDGACRRLMIRASAGAGKTYQLSSRFLSLLERGAAADEILATTFTRKAAGEILQRVLQRLAKAALHDKDRQELARAIGRKEGLSSDRCHELLRSTIRQLHRLRVGTLDSFFVQLAGGFSLELGFPPGWRIGEETDVEAFRDEALDRVLRRGSETDVLSILNLLSKGEAVRSVHQLMQDTVDKAHALYRESPASAWTRVERPPGLSEPMLEKTLEELRNFDLSDAKALDNGRKGDLERAELGEWGEFIAKGLAKKVAEGDCEFNRRRIPQPLVNLYRKLLDHAASELVGLTVFQTRAAFDLLGRYDQELSRLKHERRQLRFEDVTYGLAALAADSSRLAWRMDGAIRHLLLDEFQDTSRAQWRVIRPLVERVVDADGDFFCVGDVKQAIYGWRGGVAQLFDALPDQAPDLEQRILAESWRSSPVVLEAVNEVFQNLTAHANLGQFEPAVRAWAESFPPHTTARRDLPGYVSLETAPEGAEGQRKLAVLKYAAQRVERLTRLAPGRSIGVLTRTNAAVGQMVYLLRQLHVDVSEEGGNPLTDSAGVELILSLLRLADHPGDKVARFHVAHSALGERLGLPDHQDRYPAERLAADLRREIQQNGLGPSVGRWVGLLEDCCDSREASRLRQLVEQAYEFDQVTPLRTTHFIKFVETTKVADPSGAQVRVMNIHQAKGLEFDIVVLPELDKEIRDQPGNYVVRRPAPTEAPDCILRSVSKEVRSLLPAEFQTMFEDRALQVAQEALCVLYVALTRARQGLYMFVQPSKENEKTIPRSCAALLRAALLGNDRVGPGQLLYERGTKDWFKHDQAPAAGVLSAVKPRPTPIEFSPAGARRRHLERRSPSGLEGGSFVRLQHALDRAESQWGMAYGTLIHAWFELIEWLEDGPPSPEQRRQAAAACDAAPALVHAWPAFDEMLARPAISAALRRSAYERAKAGGPGGLRLEVRNEFPFAYRDGDRLISGAIDRLVLVYEGDRLLRADVLDFKTDVIQGKSSKSLQAKVEYYAPQIQAYRRAVSSMTGLAPESIDAKLLFVGAGIVQSV